MICNMIRLDMKEFIRLFNGCAPNEYQKDLNQFKSETINTDFANVVMREFDQANKEVLTIKFPQLYYRYSVQFESTKNPDRK